MDINEIIKGDISDNVIFDFEEGIQTSDNKLSYKGKVYNVKLILTSDSEVITCIDDGKYYAYKEKNSDEIVSGIGTCLYDGTTGDFSGDTIKDLSSYSSVSNIVEEGVNDNIYSALALSFFASISYFSLKWVCFCLIPAHRDVWGYLLKYALPSAIYTALFVIPFYYLIKYISKKTHYII